MVLSRLLCSAAASAAALLLMLAMARAAMAMEVPPAEVLTTLRAACDTSDVVRVSTSHNRYEMRRLTLDSAGVHQALTLGRPALITIGAVPREEKLIPWAEITRVEAGRLHVGRSVLAGFVVGVALGGGLITTYGPDIGDYGDSGMVWAGASLAVLSLIGGYLHGISSPHYEVLLTQNPSRR